MKIRRLYFLLILVFGLLTSVASASPKHTITINSYSMSHFDEVFISITTPKHGEYNEYSYYFQSTLYPPKTSEVTVEIEAEQCFIIDINGANRRDIFATYSVQRHENKYHNFSCIIKWPIKVNDKVLDQTNIIVWERIGSIIRQCRYEVCIP